MRVGWGVDAHAFAAEGVVLLAGVLADSGRGVAATSDGDVAAHAVIDALLGAAALGDIGTHFPPDDPRYAGANSMELLGFVVSLLDDAGFRVHSIDLTVVAQSIRVAPLRDSMRAALAGALGVGLGAVSVKATTSDGLGFTGRDEGLAVFAVAVLDD